MEKFPHQTPSEVYWLRFLVFNKGEPSFFAACLIFVCVVGAAVWFDGRESGRSVGVGYVVSDKLTNNLSKNLDAAQVWDVCVRGG